jgi:TetR/AcrR family transcriptional regulator, ethionamide resistance regulator
MAQPLPGVRRRKPSKGDLTSQAILETTERLLADRDITEITIDELTTGAGISRSAFYFHFESREAVLYVLAEKALAELYVTAGAWTEGKGEPAEEALTKAIAGSVALWRKHGPVLRAATRARETSRTMTQFWSEMDRKFVLSVAERIEADRADGKALPGPPTAKSLALSLVSMNDQVFYHHSRTRRSAATDREVVHTLTTIWLRSIYGTYGQRWAPGRR